MHRKAIKEKKRKNIKFSQQQYILAWMSKKKTEKLIKQKKTEKTD